MQMRHAVRMAVWLRFTRNWVERFGGYARAEASLRRASPTLLAFIGRIWVPSNAARLILRSRTYQESQKRCVSSSPNCLPKLRLREREGLDGSGRRPRLSCSSSGDNDDLRPVAGLGVGVRAGQATLRSARPAGIRQTLWKAGHLFSAVLGTLGTSGWF